MVRKAVKEDAKDIVRINVNSWKETYKKIFPIEFLNKLDPKDVSAIEKCERNIDEYVVYEQEGKIVAMARYGINKKGYDKTYAEIYALYVDLEYKNQGIGTKMIDYIFKILKDDFKYVLISTLKENSANEFYKKIGGKLIGESNFSLTGSNYLENLYEYIL